MRVSISTTVGENIDKIYFDKSEELLDYLARDGCDLNWGSGSKSLMGLCYDVFSRYNRKIYGFTSPKYFWEIKILPKAKHKKFSNTIDLKKRLLLDCDFYLCLPGGMGAISEFFTILEEVRSNDANIPIILYNVNNHFDKIIELLQDLVNRNFNSKSVFEYFKVVNNLEEFKEAYKNIKNC